MHYISSQDFMNFHGWISIALGWLQLHITHKIDTKENMRFELNIFQFALCMFKKII